MKEKMRSKIYENKIIILKNRQTEIGKREKKHDGKFKLEKCLS